MQLPPRSVAVTPLADIGLCRSIMPEASASRLPPITEEAPLVAEVFARLRAGGRTPLNLHQTLAHAPELMRAMLGLAEALRHDSTTLAPPSRARHSPDGAAREIAVRAGAAPADGARRRHRRCRDRSARPLADSSSFDDRERAALAYAENIAGGAPANDAELDRLFTPGEIVELTVTVAFYLMTARVIRALDVRIETAAEAALPPR